MCASIGDQGRQEVSDEVGRRLVASDEEEQTEPKERALRQFLTVDFSVDDRAKEVVARLLSPHHRVGPRLELRMIVFGDTEAGDDDHRKGIGERVDEVGLAFDLPKQLIDDLAHRRF